MAGGMGGRAMGGGWEAREGMKAGSFASGMMAVVGRHTNNEGSSLNFSTQERNAIPSSQLQSHIKPCAPTSLSRGM